MLDHAQSLLETLAASAEGTAKARRRAGGAGFDRVQSENASCLGFPARLGGRAGFFYSPSSILYPLTFQICASTAAFLNPTASRVATRRGGADLHFPGRVGGLYPEHTSTAGLAGNSIFTAEYAEYAENKPMKGKP
jgi:hypothetical protein